MLALLLLLTSAAFATSEEASLLEKSYGRDNSFCTVEGKRMEVLLRGYSRYTEAPEMFTGEFALVTDARRSQIKVLPVGQETVGHFHLFKGKGSLCSKSFGFKTGKDELAILFSKQNEPAKGRLLIQLFDYKKFEPKKFIETHYTADRAEASKTGFVFRTYSDQESQEMGKVPLKKVEFIYQDRPFPFWVEYADEHYIVRPDLTFKRLPWRRFFTSEDDFLKTAGWDSAEKKFTNTIFYFAVSHATKKKCLLVVKERRKPNGSEGWRCK
jgi:hypothetical protein